MTYNIVGLWYSNEGLELLPDTFLELEMAVSYGYSNIQRADSFHVYQVNALGCIKVYDSDEPTPMPEEK